MRAITVPSLILGNQPAAGFEVDCDQGRLGSDRGQNRGLNQDQGAPNFIFRETIIVLVLSIMMSAPPPWL